MSNDTEYERTKEYLKGKLPMYLRSKNINVNAPFTCLNPEHHDTEQSMHYEKQSHTVNCSKCNARYDIFDVVKLMYNLDSFAQSFNKVHEMYLGPVPDEMNKDQPSLIASKQRQFMMPKNSFSEQSLLHGASASNMDAPQRNSWQRAQAEIKPNQVKSMASVKYATNFGSSATSKNSAQGRSQGNGLAQSNAQNDAALGISIEQSSVSNTTKSKTLGTAIITEGTSSSVKSRKAPNVSRQESNIPHSRTVKNGTSVARITAVSLSPEERRKLSEIKNLDQLPSDIAESVLSSERFKSSRQPSDHQRQEPTLQLPREDNLSVQQSFSSRRNHKADTGFKIDPRFKNDSGLRIDPSFNENTLQGNSVFNSASNTEKYTNAEQYTSEASSVRALSDFSLPQALSQGVPVFKPVVESATTKSNATPNFFENAQKSNLGQSSSSHATDAATLGVGVGIDPSISEKVNKAYANVWGEHDKVNQQKRAAAAQAAIESQKRRQREEEFSKQLQQQQYQNLGHSSLGLEIQDDSPYLSPNQNIKDFEQAKAKRQVLNESNFISGNVKLDLPESLKAQLQNQESDPHALVETLAANSPFTQIRPQTLGDTGALQAISNQGNMRNNEQDQNRLSNAAQNNGRFAPTTNGRFAPSSVNNYHSHQYQTSQAPDYDDLYGNSSNSRSSVISRTNASQEINSSPIADIMSKLNGTSNGSSSNGNSRLGKGATTADLNTSTPSNEWKQVFGNAELRLLNPSAPSTLINGRAYDTQLDEQTLRTNIERNLASDTARIQAENARTPSSLYETAKGRPEQPSTHIYGSAVNDAVKDDSLAAPRPSASDPYIAAKHPSSAFASMVAANTASSLGDSTAIGVTGNSLSAMVGAAMAKDMAKAAAEQNSNTSTVIQRSSSTLSPRVGIESTAGLSQSISEQIRKEQSKTQQHNEGTTRIVGVISKVEPQVPLEQSTRIIVSDPNSQPVQDQLPPLETGSSYSSTIFSGVMKDKLMPQNKSKKQQAKKGHRGPKIDFSSVKSSTPDSTFTTETSHSVQIDLTNLEMDRVATLNAQTNKTNEKHSTPLNFYARAQDAIDDPSLASKAILVDEYPSRDDTAKSQAADGNAGAANSLSGSQNSAFSTLTSLVNVQKHVASSSSNNTASGTTTGAVLSSDAASASTEELTQALAKSAAAISAAAAIKAASDSFDKDLEELGIKDKSSTKHSLSESSMVKELKSSLNSLDKLLEATTHNDADDKQFKDVELNKHAKSKNADTSITTGAVSSLSNALNSTTTSNALSQTASSSTVALSSSADHSHSNLMNVDKDTVQSAVNKDKSHSAELNAAEHSQNLDATKDSSDSAPVHSASKGATSNISESSIDKLTPEEKEKALKLGIELLHAEDLLKDPSKLPAHARVIMANKTQKISSNQQDALELIQELIASKQQATSDASLDKITGAAESSTQVVNPQPSKVITPTMITAPGSKIPIAAPILPQMQQPANPMLNPAMMGNPLLGQPMVNPNLMNVMNVSQNSQVLQSPAGMMGAMGVNPALGANQALGVNQALGTNQPTGINGATNLGSVVSASGQTVVSGQGAAQNALQAVLNPAQSAQSQQQAMLQNQKLEEAHHHGASVLTQTTAISGLAQEQAAALSQGLVHQDLTNQGSTAALNQNPSAVSSAALTQSSSAISSAALTHSQSTVTPAASTTSAALEFWVKQKGLSPEIVERFNLGYLSQLPVGNQTWKVGLIPLSEDYQQILNVQTGQSMIMGEQEAPCFNLSVLTYEGDGIANAIFIVSSPLDALSLESLGAHALALTKPENTKVLLDYLQENQQQTHAFYISLENTKAWQAASERLTWGLNALQQPFKLINLAAPFDTISLALYHDRSGLLNRLQSPEVLNSLVISPSSQVQDAAEPQAASALAQESNSLTNKDSSLSPAQSATLNNQFQLLEVFAPMKDSGLILSTESLAKLQLSNVLYTMTTSSVAVSRLVLSSVILNQEPVLFAGSKMQWQMICNRLASLPVGGVLSNTGLTTATPVSPEATHDMASGIAPQPCQARLVELPLEFDTKSLLITLTQAVMTARNSLPNFGSLRLMLDTFSFEERFCAALAPLLAELALSLNLPIMVWCTNEQKSYFEGQSVQTIEMSKGMDNEIIFKTLDQDCHLHTFRSLPR